MQLRHCLYKILKNQNALDRRMDNMKTVYPSQTQFEGGGVYPHKHSLQGV